MKSHVRMMHTAMLLATAFLLAAAGSTVSAQVVLWSDDFDDGEIASDWDVDNPGYPNKITLETSTAQSVSPQYSLKVSSPAKNGYGGGAVGPLVPVDVNQPYSISFKFRYEHFHWYHMCRFGPVLLTMDKETIRLRWYTGKNWQYLGKSNIGSYCPKDTWTHFRIDVDQQAGIYDVFVDGVFRGRANPGTWDSGDRGFRFRECPHNASEPNYVYNGYYDDISISGIPSSVPFLTWIPSNKDFGNVPVGLKSDVYSYRLKNTGAYSTSGSVSTTGDFHLQGGGSYSLSPGDSAYFDVYFEPTQHGPCAGKIIASSDNRPEADLTGEGVDLGLKLTVNQRDGIVTVPFGGTALAEYDVRAKTMAGTPVDMFIIVKALGKYYFSYTGGTGWGWVWGKNTPFYTGPLVDMNGVFYSKAIPYRGSYAVSLLVDTIPNGKLDRQAVPLIDSMTVICQ